MDTELKCNRLTCRKALADKAVVTTCSHIFCVDCANELFTTARLCPACETCLTEPDDIVVCSLQPTNDYKTSVLSGLSPCIILEICSRAISFWQYQIHQENSFQQAVIRNLSDKNAQLQKQLDNVVREANGEINLLGNKIAQLERDLELERRKVRDLQETSRERDKEYQKLKGWTQHDKLKRKTLLGPTTIEQIAAPQSKTPEGQQSRTRLNTLGGASGNEMAMSGMEMNGVQRTPLVPRVQNHAMTASASTRGSGWSKPKATVSMGGQHRQPFGPPTPQVLALDRSFRSTSEYSDSGNEVEQMLLPGSFSRSTSGWGPGAARSRPVFAPPIAPKRASMGFRPAGVNR